MHYQHTSVRYDTRNDRLFQRSLYSFEGVGIIMSKFKKQMIFMCVNSNYTLMHIIYEPYE